MAREKNSPDRSITYVGIGKTLSLHTPMRFMRKTSQNMIVPIPGITIQFLPWRQTCLPPLQTHRPGRSLLQPATRSVFSPLLRTAEELGVWDGVSHVSGSGGFIDGTVWERLDKGRLCRNPAESPFLIVEVHRALHTVYLTTRLPSLHFSY